jgi:hypothetical protein
VRHRHDDHAVRAGPWAKIVSDEEGSWNVEDRVGPWVGQRLRLVAMQTFESGPNAGRNEEGQAHRSAVTDAATTHAVQRASMGRRVVRAVVSAFVAKSERAQVGLLRHHRDAVNGQKHASELPQHGREGTPTPRAWQIPQNPAMSPAEPLSRCRLVETIRTESVRAGKGIFACPIWTRPFCYLPPSDTRFDAKERDRWTSASSRRPTSARHEFR